MSDWCELGVGRAGSFRRLTSVSTLKCDRFEELIWSGTTDGRLTSHWINQNVDQSNDQTINQRVSVPAHDSTVLFIRSFPTGLLSVSQSNVLYHSRGGVQLQSFNQSINQSMGLTINQFTAAQVPEYSPHIVLLAAQTISQTVNQPLNQSSIIACDLTTNQIIKQSHSDQSINSINCSSSTYAFGRTDGLIELRDYRSVRSIIKLSAHVGPIIDCLINEHYIVTCGMTQPVNLSMNQSINQSINQSNTCDNIIKVFDVRTYRPLAPIIPRLDGPPARIGWIDQSINQSINDSIDQSINDSIYVITRNGEWQSASVNLSMMQGQTYQCSMLNQPMNQSVKALCADVSQNGENLIIGDSSGLIHRFARLKDLSINQTIDQSTDQSNPHSEIRSVTTRLDRNNSATEVQSFDEIGDQSNNQSNDQFENQNFQSTDQSNNQSFNQPDDQSFDQTLDQSNNQLFNQPVYSSTLNHFSQETPYAPSLMELYQSVNQSNDQPILSFDGPESLGSIDFPYELNHGLVSDWSSIKQSIKTSTIQPIDHRLIPNVQWHNNIGYVNLRSINQPINQSVNRLNKQSNKQSINQLFDQFRAKGLIIHAPKTVLQTISQSDFDSLTNNSEYCLQSIKQSIHQSIEQAIKRSIKQFNQSPFTCLDSMLPNSYCNVLLINLYFNQTIRINALNHLCFKENCVRCELGFLFHMMDCARNNQSNNQSINQSNNQSNNSSSNQLAEKSDIQSVASSNDNSSFNQTNSQSSTQTINPTIDSLPLERNNQTISQPIKASGGAMAEPRNFLRALSQIPEAIGLGLLDEMDYRQSINQSNIQSINLHKNWPKEPLTVKIKPSVNQVPLIDRIQSCQRFILEQLRKEESIDQSNTQTGKQSNKQSNKQTPKRDKRNQSSKSPRPESATPTSNQTLSQPNNLSATPSTTQPPTRLLMDQVFGHTVEYINECEGSSTRSSNQATNRSINQSNNQPSHQTVNRVNVLYEKLTYSSTIYTSNSPLPQTVYVSQQISFADLLTTSLINQSINRFWCNQCCAYRTIKVKRRIIDLPNVLNIECNIQDKLASQIWKQSNNQTSSSTVNQSDSQDTSNNQSNNSTDQAWLPLYLAFQLTESETKVVRLTEAEARARSNEQSTNQWIYELSSVISMITDPPSATNRSDEHFVMRRKIPDSYFAQSNNQSNNQSNHWYVFNDFVIRPSSPFEATNFQYAWKQPCLLTYTLMSNNQSNNQSPPQYVNPFLSLPFPYQKSLASRSSALRTFVPLSPSEHINSSLRVAIDCEFVCISSELSGFDFVTGEVLLVRPSRTQLARVSIVRVNGVPLMDDYLLANEPIVDYLTRYSGLKHGDLERATSSHHLTTLKQTYIRLRHLIDHGVTFIGHGLESDFRVCNLILPPHQVIDTVKLYSLPHQRKLSLRFLAVHLLGVTIQQDVHDSIEDARTALALVKHYEHIQAQANGKQQIQTMIQHLYAIGRREGFKV